MPKEGGGANKGNSNYDFPGIGRILYDYYRRGVLDGGGRRGGTGDGVYRVVLVLILMSK